MELTTEQYGSQASKNAPKVLSTSTLDLVSPWRKELEEAFAPVSDELMEMLLADQDFATEQIVGGLRQSTISKRNPTCTGRRGIIPGWH